MSVLSNLRARRAAGNAVEAPAASVSPPSVAEVGGPLSPQQLRFFETFGFIKLPRLFADAVDRMAAGFEEAFAQSDRWETNEALHFEQRRLIVPGVIDRSPNLSWMRDDPRVTELVASVLGEGYEFANSDGSLFYCDTSWHPDSYGAPMSVYHLKLSFYLEPLHGANGAIRMMPGTNFHNSPYALAVREGVDDPSRIREVFGVEPDELPSWTLESEPGDCIAWNFRTVHASFNGGERRRLFSLNFREAASG